MCRFINNWEPNNGRGVLRLNIRECDAIGLNYFIEGRMNGMLLIWRSNSNQMLYVGRGNILENVRIFMQQNGEQYNNYDLYLLCAEFTENANEAIQRHIEKYIYLYYLPELSTYREDPDLPCTPVPLPAIDGIETHPEQIQAYLQQ